MAVAARPSPSDARVPCTQCGGLIHPIAGRCKHCKADLSALRGPRPAAVAALPALAKAGTIDVAYPEAAAPHAAVTKLMADPAIVAASTISVLPPRPEHSAHLQVAGPERGWFGRNWPVVVIVLAAIAIIGAVVLMLLPPGEADAASKKAGAPGPASDRMETSPLLPQPDPHANNGGAPQVQPPVPPLPDPLPDPSAQVDPNAAPDPFANPFAGGGLAGGNAMMSMLSNIATRLCEKAKNCSDPSIANACAPLATIPKLPLPANCPAAQKCIDAMDQVDVCNAGSMTDFQSLALSTSACVEVLTQCT